MTERFAQAKAVARERSGNVRSVRLKKALNLVSEGMLKEGMSEPSVFSRFPDAKALLQNGVLSDTIALMTDLSPFSSFVAGASASDVRDLLNAYYDEVVPLIEAQGGVVEKYIGDAVVALFGAPFGSTRTTSDHVHAAFTAARRVTKAVHDLFRHELHAKCAISRGEMFLGLVGPSTHSELTAIGNPLTVLFRLEELATANALVLPTELYEQISDRFHDVTGVPSSGESWKLRQEQRELRGAGETRVTYCEFNL